MNNLYFEHPIRFDVGGEPSEVRETTRDLLKLCHQTFYSPSNMNLVVVGDIDIDKTMELIDIFDENNKIQLVSVEDYPISFTLQGSGTENDPYLIHNPQEWNEATTKAQQVGVHFKIANDIDFTNEEAAMWFYNAANETQALLSLAYAQEIPHEYLKEIETKTNF